MKKFLTSMFFIVFVIISINFSKAQTLFCPNIHISRITDETMGSFFPSINSDGTLISFYSTANINGGNLEGNDEIYLFNTITGIIRQVTDETSAQSIHPRISRDGLKIAFQLNSEIYLYDTNADTFTQITNSISGGSLYPSINSDGTRIAFHSNANINGGNPEGNFEIYLYDTNSDTFTQITDSISGNSELSSINSDGMRIAFQSDANINGGNIEGNREIYLYDTNTGIITQITDLMSGISSLPSINSDGTRIAFDSTSNLNGGNPEGNREIYLYDTNSDTFTQITDSISGNSERASINSDGTRIAFESTSNMYGGNADGNDDIYLATCFSPNSISSSVPTLSEWGLIMMAGILGLVGFMVIRRRHITALK